MSYLAGKIILDIPAGAPNNGNGDGNVSPVKQMWRDRECFPYVSAQAYRRWLRDTLAAGTEASPVFRSKSGKNQQAYTAGEPHQYLDDDLFGYMRAVKDDETQRDSVLSVGTLLATTPNRPVEDFGTMSRGFAADENPVLHGHEFYGADLATDVVVDVARIGTFPLGGAGHRRNLNDEQRTAALELPGASMLAATADDVATGFRGIDAVRLGIEERRDRLARLLLAVSETAGGAKQALHFTDVTPSFVLLAPIAGGVNPFTRIVQRGPKGTQVSADVLAAAIDDWADKLTGPVHIGWDPGWRAEQRQGFEATVVGLGDKVVFGRPRPMLVGLADQVRAGGCDAWFADPVS